MRAMINGHVPIVPGVAWNETDYTSLRMTLRLYDDMIVAMKHEAGGPETTFVVDPLELAQRLGGLDVQSGILPRNCLFWQRRSGQERLAVYVPSQVWRMEIAANGKLEVPLPGLVFIGQGKKYGAWAVVEPEGAPVGWLPHAGTALYRCPTPNISGDGVCAGSVQFPVAGAGTIWSAVSLFFESRFNNHLSNGKSLSHPECVLELWHEIADSEVYPVKDLVKVKSNLGGLMG